MSLTAHTHRWPEGRCTTSRHIDRGIARLGRHGRYRLRRRSLTPSHRSQGRARRHPNSPSRALKYPLDKHLDAQRHLVECCSSKLKQFRRVATRFEKTAQNYRTVVTLAAIVLWMR